ncbi:Hypothetical predicted protein [Lecanosticta acicola]|uniref:Ribosome assembly protein 3 n=1 Tax=Lecanosticta acicola TaxID=111012 RepID=A0AAI8Z7N4_9PEZI|nr:Hypothetical predicted protein [Lecanosticta acicola]
MAPSKEESKKRRNKRKSRTEVSSPSSSDSEAESKPQQNLITEEPEDSDMKDARPNEEIRVPQQRRLDPEKAFEEFYLRQVTKEFANDLDKLRSAGDFNEKSIPMLVRALKQGTSCFSQDDKQRISNALAEAE